MICPNCQSENPNTARFCLNCGVVLGNYCPNCQADLPPRARYCMHCGQSLRATTSDDTQRHKRLAAAAALYMASSRTLIRTYAAEYPSQPELVLSNVNRRTLSETHSGLFVTVFYGILDPSTGKLNYANAGHNPPYLLSAHGDKSVQALHKTGPALGIIEDGTWEQEEIELDPGGILMIYTDGLTDAQNEDEVMFSEERVIEIMRANMGRTAQELLQALLTEVHDFVGDAPRFDDLTIVTIVHERSPS